MGRILYIYGVLLCVACQFPVPEMEEPSEEELQLMGQIDQYYADFTAKDWGRFTAHFWEKGMLTPTEIWEYPDSFVRSIPIAQYLERMALDSSRINKIGKYMVEAELSLEGNLAQAWVKFEVYPDEANNAEFYQGIDAFTLKKHKEEWKIVSCISASQK